MTEIKEITIKKDQQVDGEPLDALEVALAIFMVGVGIDGEEYIYSIDEVIGEVLGMLGLDIHHAPRDLFNDVIDILEGWNWHIFQYDTDFFVSGIGCARASVVYFLDAEVLVQGGEGFPRDDYQFLSVFKETGFGQLFESKLGEKEKYLPDVIYRERILTEYLSGYGIVYDAKNHSS